MNIDKLLIVFDQMGFAPTTFCEDPDECACEWKKQLVAEIERLKAENDKLDKESTAYDLIIQKQDKEREDLLGKNLNLQKRNDELLKEITNQYKRLEKQCIRTVKQAKSEAVKDFAEKLKDPLNGIYIPTSYRENAFETIDELLKEYEE